MKRLAAILAALVVLVPAAAHGSACSPLNCAASQFLLDHGNLLAVRASTTAPVRVIDLRNGTTTASLPAGVVENGTLVSKHGAEIAWDALATGARIDDVSVTGNWSLVGASQDAKRAVLTSTRDGWTTFAVVPRGAPPELVKVRGESWAFDALSGSNLFLIQYVPNGYYVRLFDLATRTLLVQPLKSPGEDARISGVPFVRVASPNGRYLFTLYVGGDGSAMIHQLDLARAKAICIDLPAGTNTAAATTWALVADPDGRRIWAINPGYGKVVSVDVAGHRVNQTWAFDSQGLSQYATGTAVLSPDGSHFALTDTRHVWFLTLGSKLAVRRVNRGAVALGWAPDQSALLTVGKNGEVSRLQPTW